MLQDYSFSSVVDSHYAHVKARIIAANASRQFGGIMEAQGWPGPSVKLEAFYLLTLGESPAGRSMGSIADQTYFFTLQWTWIIAGTSLTDTVQGQNRGDRYRLNTSMKNELRHGAFPLFTEKRKIGFDSFDYSITKTSFDPKEYLHWSKFSFTQKLDGASGLIYGMATTYVTSTTEEILV